MKIHELQHPWMRSYYSNREHQPTPTIEASVYGETLTAAEDGAQLW